MSLNIEHPEVERLATEVAALTGESRIEAIRQALLERRHGLRRALPRSVRIDQIRDFLQTEVWSRVPHNQVGHAPTKAERAEVLGMDL